MHGRQKHREKNSFSLCASQALLYKLIDMISIMTKYKSGTPTPTPLSTIKASLASTAACRHQRWVDRHGGRHHGRPPLFAHPPAGGGGDGQGPRHRLLHGHRLPLLCCPCLPLWRPAQRLAGQKEDGSSLLPSPCARLHRPSPQPLLRLARACQGVHRPRCLARLPLRQRPRHRVCPPHGAGQPRVFHLSLPGHRDAPVLCARLPSALAHHGLCPCLPASSPPSLPAPPSRVTAMVGLAGAAGRGICKPVLGSRYTVPNDF